MIRIHQTLQTTDLGAAEPAGLLPEFLTGLLETDSNRLVANVETKFSLAQIDDFYFPITSNDLQYGNSYVCSPYTGMI